MKNNREMEGPKYKRNKEKKSRRGHVACRKERGSFLILKIRLRVIHKKRKRGKEETRERKKKKRREERRKGKEDRRYLNYVCMELVKFHMEKYRFLYNSMGLFSFGYRKNRYMVWNPPSSVWFEFGNSQTHFSLGLS